VNATNNLAWAALGGVCAAGGLAAWASMVPSSQVFGATVRGTGDDRAIALTFDDGPNPAATPLILDVLDRHQARATFFVMGSHVRAFPDLTAEIVKRGHLIGNHTETHPRLNLTSPSRTRHELKQCAQAIAEAARTETKWMRPPYGYRSPWLDPIVKGEFASEVVMWTNMAQDWKFSTPEPVIQRLRSAGGGDIVVLHDGDHRVLEGKRAHVAGALAYWMPRWRDAGLRFVTLDEIQSSTEAAEAAQPR
jgi:peptidoglycan/xylan/chitin deacetylase (PgdA/CDA1 family)